jgi:hypothetical protein
MIKTIHLAILVSFHSSVLATYTPSLPDALSLQSNLFNSLPPAQGQRVKRAGREEQGDDSNWTGLLAIAESEYDVLEFDDAVQEAVAQQEVVAQATQAAPLESRIGTLAHTPQPRKRRKVSWGDGGESGVVDATGKSELEELEETLNLILPGQDDIEAWLKWGSSAIADLDDRIRRRGGGERE